MVVISPSGGRPLLPFSSVTHQRLHQSTSPPGPDAEQAPGAPFGQPLPGGRLAWAANGAALEVLCCRTGARRAAWTFGAHRPDAPPPQVTAVSAVSEAAGPAADHLLAVGLDCGTEGGGMVCVFDLAAAAVVRAVQLPHQVTALAVLRAPADSPDLCQPLQAMGVLAAVGTHAGFVLLLDLCLDGPRDTSERSPGAPTYVTVLEPAVEQRREEQAALGNHLCLPLNDAAVEAGMYRHSTPHGRVEHARPADDTWVSAVHWVSQLRSLVVGLSFGCFQVWSLETLQLEYASRFEAGQLPVVSCVFLEPENDPRRFIYLWILNSVPAYHDMNGSVASAGLYALLYSERQWEQGTPVYRGLEQAGLKLVYDLTTTPEQPDAGRVSASCLLSAFPLPAAGGDSSGAADDSLAPRDATRCALAWEAWTEDGASACTCLALFDLNRWYQAHMPHRVDAATLERCEFLRFFSLDAREGIVMGLSVRAAESNSGLLSTTLLLDVGVQPLTFCGPQEQLLRTLQAAGGAQLAHPLQAYEAARRLGLVPPGAVSPSEQREALLTLALERGFSSLLAACASRWSSGDSDPAGCTLRALLDWLWRRAVDIVTRIDAACQPLFDLSGGLAVEEEVTALHGLRAQLDGLCHVLDTMATRTANTDGGRAELESKSYVLRVRSLHTAVILWLCHAGLLPEQADSPGEEAVEFAYPGAALAQWYAERRRQLGRRTLMVDGMVEEMGEPLREYWREEGEGDGAYPPRSLQSLTRAYLLDGVPDVRKHRLTHYLLLDLSRLVSDDHYDTLKSFPSSFAMSPSLIKLTHAFWHLDHGSVDSALVFLMDPLVQPGDITPWQHRRIVESLLAQEAPRAALQYAQARHLPAPNAADLRLHMRVLLDNGLVTEALRYERSHRALGGEELAGFLLTGCQQRRLLTQLMRQPLDAVLERRFIEFLQENADRECAELLHVFYLQRGRYREAAGLQRRLSAAAAPAAPERADFRQALHQLLPGLTHRREGSPQTAALNRLGVPGARRQPLSAQLHQVPNTVRSRAILIQELLEQENNKPAPPPVAATPFRPRHKRKLPEDDEIDGGTPRSGQRRPLRSDVRRLLQTPPVRRAPRRSDVEVGTPQARTPAAVMTPQSILKVRRYLEASGARGEDTPSKQLRFGLLRGRRSLEESRAEVTPPPLATLFTPGKTPAPLRLPARAAPAAAAPAERSPSPETELSPVRLARLFTPGKTPPRLAARAERLPEPRIAIPDALVATERTPTPEPISPPRKRQSIASELDDSEFYSFEASPTVANQTLEIFGRERQLRLVERSWRDEGDGAVSGRSRAGDDGTVSEDRGSPVSQEGGQRHSTPQQEGAAPRSPQLGSGVSLAASPLAGETTGRRAAEDSAAVDSPRHQHQLVTPRRELRRTSSRLRAQRETPTVPGKGDRGGGMTVHTEAHLEASTEVRTEVHEEVRAEVHKEVHTEVRTEVRTEVSAVSAPVGAAAATEPEEPFEEVGRRTSSSSGEFSPLLGNRFSSLATLTEGGSIRRGLESLEAQILTEAEVNTERTEVHREESPEPTGEEPVAVKRTAWVTGDEQREEGSLSALEAQVVTGADVLRAGRTETGGDEPVVETSPGEEPVAVKRTVWVTGEETERQESGLSALEAQVVTGADAVHVKQTETDGDEPAVKTSPGQESEVVKRTAWVTGEEGKQEGEEGPGRGLAALEAQVVTDASAVHAGNAEAGRGQSPEEESRQQEPAAVKRVAWVTGEEEQQAAEDTSPLSSSYLEPPAGMQEALQRIGRALDIPEWSGTDAPPSSLTSTGSALLSSGSEVTDNRLELRLESDSEDEQQEPAEDSASLQQRPEEPPAPSPPSSPAADRRTRAAPLRQTSPEIGSPLLTPRRSLRRRAAEAEVTETRVTTAVVEGTVTEVRESEEMETEEPAEVAKEAAPAESSSLQNQEEEQDSAAPKARSRTPSPKKVDSDATPSPKRSPRVASQPPNQSPRVATPSSKRSQRVASPSPKRSPRKASPSPKRSPRVVTPSPSESPRVTTPSPKRSPRKASLSPKGSPRKASPSPKRSPRVATPSPRRSLRMTTPSPKRSPRLATPSPKRSPSVTPVSPKMPPPEKPISVTGASPVTGSPKGSPFKASPSKTALAKPSPEVSPSVPRDSPKLETHSTDPVSPAPEIASPSPSAAEESTEPASSPEVKLATPPAPVAKITTPTSSPRPTTRAETARPEPTTLSPLAEEHPSEVPSSPPAGTVTPSSVRRTGRRSVTGAATPRSRLSLLAAVDPLSPVPEGRSVGAAAGDSADAAAEEPAETEEPAPEPEPVSAQKTARTRASSLRPATPSTPVRRSSRRRSVSLEPEGPAAAAAEVGARGWSLRGASAEPEVLETAATPGRSLRPRQASEEPEKRGGKTSETKPADDAPPPGSTQKGRRARKASEEPERETSEAPATPTRSLRRRQASEEPEKRGDKISEAKPADDAPPPGSTQKGRRARKASEEPEQVFEAPATPTRSLRRRQASEEPERKARKISETKSDVDSAPVASTQKGRRTRKASEDPEKEVKPDATEKTGRTTQVSDEKHYSSAVDTARKTRQTRNASVEPEEQSVADTAPKTRRARKTSGEPEQTVAGDANKTRRAGKASEESEDLPLADGAPKTRRARKASEPPEEQSISDAAHTSRLARNTSEQPGQSSEVAPKARRTRKVSEGPEEAPSLATTQKNRRTRKESEEPEEPPVFDNTHDTRRTRKVSETVVEPPVLDSTHKTWRTRKTSGEEQKETVQKSRRTRKASEEPEEPSLSETAHATKRTGKASEEHAAMDSTRKSRRGRKTSEEPVEPVISESSNARAARTRKTSEPADFETSVTTSTSKRTRQQSQAGESSVTPTTPERAPKARRFQRVAAEDAASPARNTRARSLSVQPESPQRLPTRAASEQPPEAAQRGASTRKRRATTGEAPEAPGEQSPPLRRRVGRSGAAPRRSQLPAIAETAAAEMPPPASATAGRRRRRPAPEEEEEEEAGSPLTLLTEEQLESLRRRGGTSPEPVSRDRRTSIARTRQRTGGRRSVRLW